MNQDYLVHELISMRAYIFGLLHLTPHIHLAAVGRAADPVGEADPDGTALGAPDELGSLGGALTENRRSTDQTTDLRAAADGPAKTSPFQVWTAAATLGVVVSRMYGPFAATRAVGDDAGFDEAGARQEEKCPVHAWLESGDFCFAGEAYIAQPQHSMDYFFLSHK